MKAFNKEQMKQLREMLKPKTSYERFIDDVFTYLDSKLKDYSIPTHTLQELAEYINLKTVNYAREEFKQYQRMEIRQMSKGSGRRQTEGDNGWK